MRIEKVIFNELRVKKKYTYYESDFDIALLKLADEVDIAVYTPICLPELGRDYLSSTSNRWATVIGKGG